MLHAASLGVRAIGQGLAEAQGLAPKGADIKQVVRPLSNPALSMASILACWERLVAGRRTEIGVSFDRTEFEDADQSMVMMGMQTGHFDYLCPLPRHHLGRV